MLYDTVVDGIIVAFEGYYITEEKRNFASINGDTFTLADGNYNTTILGKDINIESTGAFTLNAAKKITVHTVNGPMDITIDNPSDLVISKPKDISITNTGRYTRTSGGGVNISSGGEYNVTVVVETINHNTGIANLGKQPKYIAYSYFYDMTIKGELIFDTMKHLYLNRKDIYDFMDKAFEWIKSNEPELHAKIAEAESK